MKPPSDVVSSHAASHLLWCPFFPFQGERHRIGRLCSLHITIYLELNLAATHFLFWWKELIYWFRTIFGGVSELLAQIMQ